MKIHEYQAKALLQSYGAPVPAGIVVKTADEAADAAEKMPHCVLKAQIHSGGRGKAGGVRLANGPEEARQIAAQLLGSTLVTKQTGPSGKQVRTLLVTEAVTVKQEYYLAIAGDMDGAGLMLISSREGGTEIEQTAAEHPACIAKLPVSVLTGFCRYEGLEAARQLGLPQALLPSFLQLLEAMVKLYLEKDCSLVEINPLAVTEDDTLVCLDAKITFDDNALWRHPELLSLRDVAEEDEKEYLASQFDLSYIHLSGSIGCLVNGAGLAMATMDMIHSCGGQPANFLDVGGSATEEKVAAAFEILLSDKNVRAIFVNIFGGIMKCDLIAQGIVAAAKKSGIPVPLIVRLEGTNVELGREILRSSGLQILAASDMADGARQAVEAAREVCR